MSTPKRIDMHCHVGLLGDEYPQWGRISPHLQSTIAYKIFLLYARVPEDQVCDRVLREAVEKTIDGCDLDHVVCLALDPVYDRKTGARREDRSNLWVDNAYVLELQRNRSKVLFGASVHPYDPKFEDRVRDCVAKGAVLLKWLPSAQQIDLADPRVKTAVEFLATAKDGGRPLPLLLHVGPEYAIPTTDPRTTSYDFLTWSSWDAVANLLRGKKKWAVPKESAIKANLDAAVRAGAVIIFAHAGLPYFAPRWLKFSEHSDFATVARCVRDSHEGKLGSGRCYADVSAVVTPFRKTYFKDLKELPAERLLFGGDYPVPVFELSADVGEMWDDFKAVMKGDLDRVVIPEDNLLDVNHRELRVAFPAHPMFTNFANLI